MDGGFPRGKTSFPCDRPCEEIRTGCHGDPENEAAKQEAVKDVGVAVKYAEELSYSGFTGKNEG
jgi:hypothetical protein